MRFILRTRTTRGVETLVKVLNDNPGFYAFMMNDYLNPRDQNGALDTWSVLTYLAAKTEGVRLGPFVTPLPSRHPVLVASAATSLDHLSSGRLILGIGAGNPTLGWDKYVQWDKDPVRVDKTREGVELLLKLWSEDKVSFNGKHYQTKDASIIPKPVQKPHPPLLFGGGGDRMLRLAGKYGDIVSPPLSRASTLEQYEQVKRIVFDAAEKAGRRDKIQFAYRGPEQAVGGPYPDGKAISGKLEDAVKAGASYFIIGFEVDGLAESVRRFADESMSSYS
ncbi:MAG: LLM class flavin-dependent oxidoreductase [Thaumarchaeota archaeon]|nr:LLM class flavin-dependent oxidoreductase [Nitrososphaerota archaeon]